MLSGRRHGFFKNVDINLIKNNNLVYDFATILYEDMQVEYISKKVVKNKKIFTELTKKKYTSS